MKKFILFILSLTILCGCGNTKQEKEIDIANSRKEVYEKYINHYEYDLYDENKKEIYDCLYKGFKNLEKEIEITNPISQKEMDEIYLQVLYDQPEIFYVTPKITYSNHTYQVDYFYLENEIKDYQSQLEVIKNEYLDHIKGLNLVEIVDYTYLYMFEKINYDHDSFNQEDFNMIDYYDDYNIIKSLTKGFCVCTGYARTFQYLMNLAGYQCLLVNGTSFGNPHSWDALVVENQIFYFDPTWDDTMKLQPLTYYHYYGMTYQQAHAKRSFENCIFEDATSDSFSYAKTHGYYITSTKDLKSVIDKQKDHDITIIQCDDKTFKKVREEFITMDEFKGLSNNIRFEENMNIISFSNIPIINMPN